MYALFEPADRKYDGLVRHPLSELMNAVLLHGENDVGVDGLRVLELLPLIPAKHQQGVAIAVYQPGNPRILVVRRRGSFLANLVQAANAVRRHPRFAKFNIGRSARIQIDFLAVEEGLVRFRDLAVGTLDDNRFEFGVDGLRIKSGFDVHYFLPGDSYIRSIYDLGQLETYLSKLIKNAKLEGCTMERIRSTSIVTYKDRWIRLYRGHPIIQAVSVADVELACERAFKHIVSYYRKDGRFLYYYDASGDTEVDHQHPARDPMQNPYYNELRHCGGIVCLLMAYTRDPKPELRSIIERAVDFVVENSVTYQTQSGRNARYIYYNRKSKLGGAGLALYAVSYYQKILGDSRYETIAAELAEHLLECITASGEFLYYKIYMDKKITEAENKDYFSFYYPGEALVGLACYLKWVVGPNYSRAETLGKMKNALQYLLVVRPADRASHYMALPSDSWLMAAILALWEMPEFRDPSYSRFVFDDADKMVSLMYHEGNALFPDYVGAFYYNYGDLPYADGARCEGLVAALELAMMVGDSDRVRRYAAALVKTTRATLLLANTPESLYFAANEEKSLGGVRFKYTRQWFRIDTIQHVICYYLRFLSLYNKLQTDGVVLDDQFHDSPNGATGVGAIGANEFA